MFKQQSPKKKKIKETTKNTEFQAQKHATSNTINPDKNPVFRTNGWCRQY